MGRPRSKQFKKKDDRQKSKSRFVCGVEQPDTEGLAGRERYFEFFVVAVFFAFGAYHSILYFGHKIVPTSDFPAFVGIGHELLSFKVPSPTIYLCVKSAKESVIAVSLALTIN